MTDERPDIALDNIEIGQELGTIEYCFTPADVSGYASFLGDDSPWFREKAGGDPLRVNPMMFANDYSNLLRKHYQTPGLVLVQTEHVYSGTVFTGQHLQTSGKVIDMGLRNGREFVIVETWTVDEKGAEVSRTITTALLSMEKKSES